LNGYIEKLKTNRDFEKVEELMKLQLEATKALSFGRRISKILDFQMILPCLLWVLIRCSEVTLWKRGMLL